MADDLPAIAQLRDDHYELVFVGPKGTRTYCYGYQPSTDDIARDRKNYELFCIQRIGEQYEVYDLTTIKPIGWGAGHTIGLPVFVSSDSDAATMWAVMNL